VPLLPAQETVPPVPEPMPPDPDSAQVPFGDAAGEGVQQVLPDPEPAEAAPGGVLPARLVLHQRDRYEHGPQGQNKPYEF
jgi:hypothetical protein